jgi:hypothetical protein
MRREIVRADVMVFVFALAGGNALAQDDSHRPTGLPSAIDWTFQFDASFGIFGFANSLYTDPKPDQPSGDLGDDWFEGAVKPSLTGTYTSPAS